MPFDLFAYLIWTAISIGISYGIAALTKKDPKDIRYKPNTFDVPEIEEGSKFAIIFGTCWVENPVIGWWGDTEKRGFSIRIHETGGQYLYAYRYYHGALHIICQGVCDGILQIKVGDDLVWPSTDKTVFSAPANSALINLPDLYGGISQFDQNITLGGGLIGWVDFEYGESNQVLNDYLASVQGAYISANRGLTTAVLRHVYVGTDPTVQPWKYLVKRVLVSTDNSEQWYVAKAAIRTYEMNPIHLLRECYTNTEWGLSTPTNLCNDTVWQAAADALYDEGFGLCMKWEGEHSLESFIKDVLRYIDATIYEDHATGEIEIKLIRDDYVIDDLEVFDENDITEIGEFSRGTIHKIPNVTYVEYWNIYDNIPVTIPNYDKALVTSQNEMLIPNEPSYTGVINDNLAGQLAARDQYQLSSFAAMMQIKCKRTMAHLRPGDCFKLSWGELGIISMVVRVLAPHYGTLTDGEVSFDCIEDIFGMKDSLYAAPPASSWGNVPIINESIRSASMVMSTSDPTVTTNGFERIINDGIGITDDQTQLKVIVRAVADSLGITDDMSDVSGP